MEAAEPAGYLTGGEAVWRVELFGGLRLIRGAVVSTRVASPDTACLLGVLAYHKGRLCRHSVLRSLVWPREPEAAAARLLEASIRALRRQLEPPGISRGRVVVQNVDEIGLSTDAVITDVAEFGLRIEKARAAQSRHRRIHFLAVAEEQYRPELLTGYQGDWILAAQTELDDLYLEAVKVLCTDLEAEGELEESLLIASRALAVEPDDEAILQTVRRLRSLVVKLGDASWSGL
jgi:DNA-binding SARP family transcriptional activator